MSLQDSKFRSNSLDSILLADLNNRVAPVKSVLPNRNSAIEIKANLPQAGTPGQFVKKSPPLNSGSLHKRPTFESLDKRKSWSFDVSKMQNEFKPQLMTSKG